MMYLHPTTSYVSASAQKA